ncbi:MULTISPECIES: hypothetical protein [Mesorhizobium]|uniref:hypothetical protein n=1 Tax=Mesorhizobium TaxID=68287 RepID=UPI001FD949B0|nr:MULTISPECIES: hypothetical protein [Mesorhizobium]
MIDEDRGGGKNGRAGRAHEFDFKDKVGTRSSGCGLHGCRMLIDRQDGQSGQIREHEL